MRFLLIILLFVSFEISSQIKTYEASGNSPLISNRITQASFNISDATIKFDSKTELAKLTLNYSVYGKNNSGIAQLFKNENIAPEAGGEISATFPNKGYFKNGDKIENLENKLKNTKKQFHNIVIHVLKKKDVRLNRAITSAKLTNSKLSPNDLKKRLQSDSKFNHLSAQTQSYILKFIDSEKDTLLKKYKILDTQVVDLQNKSPYYYITPHFTAGINYRSFSFLKDSVFRASFSDNFETRDNWSGYLRGGCDFRSKRIDFGISLIYNRTDNFDLLTTGKFNQESIINIDNVINSKEVDTEAYFGDYIKGVDQFIFLVGFQYKIRDENKNDWIISTSFQSTDRNNESLANTSDINIGLYVLNLKANKLLGGLYISFIDIFNNIEDQTFGEKIEIGFTTTYAFNSFKSYNKADPANSLLD